MCTPKLRILLLALVALLAMALQSGAPGASAQGGWAVDAFAPAPDSTVYALAVQPDGQILVGGDFAVLGGQPRTSIGRLHPDGSLDEFFAPEALGRIYALAVQPDGSIIVAGALVALGGEPRMYIGRLAADGGLDASFDPMPDGQVNALALQPDGKIVLGGAFTSIAGQPCARICRLHPDGAPDESWVGSTDADVLALALQPDGAILLGGAFGTVNGEARSHIARVNASGVLDQGWQAETDGVVYVIVPQPDGSVLIGGAFGSVNGAPRAGLARLDSNGALDEGFAPDLRGAPQAPRVHTIATDADGRIMLGGVFFWLPDGAGNHLANLAIVEPDGALNPAGVLRTDGSVMALALQGDGKLLVGGAFAELGSEARGMLGRLDAPTAAAQGLAFDADTRSATWARSGSAPEVWRATLELSTDGVTYTALGEGARTAGGWVWGDLALPPGRDLWLRARGYYATGFGGGSGSLVETTQQVYLAWDPIPHHVPIATR
jgi:uncharacterized delta-60 repeat protein